MPLWATPLVVRYQREKMMNFQEKPCNTMQIAAGNGEFCREGKVGRHEMHGLAEGGAATGGTADRVQISPSDADLSYSEELGAEVLWHG